jgi:hypothetical protein
MTATQISIANIAREVIAERMSEHDAVNAVLVIVGIGEGRRWSCIVLNLWMAYLRLGGKPLN